MNALGVVATPARTPERNCALTRRDPPRPSGDRRRSARRRARAARRAPTGAGPRAGPGRRTARRASPRTRLGAPRPRPRTRRRGRADARTPTGKWRKHTRTATRAAALERRAVRALVVAVDDHQPALPAHVVGGADRGQRGGAEVARCSASKIRLAPGRSPGESASWLQRTVPSGSMTTSARCGKPPG